MSSSGDAGVSLPGGIASGTGSGQGGGAGAGSGSGAGQGSSGGGGSGSSGGSGSGSGPAVCAARGSGDGSGSGTNAVASCPARQVTSIVMKRIPVRKFPPNPGHWWIEINGTESYGWYPINTPGVDFTKGNFSGPGELNGMTKHPGGTATTDPHQGNAAPVTFSPMTQDGDCRTDDEIQQCIRDFVNGYSSNVANATWTWPDPCNCHDMQLDAMQNCGLTGPPGDRVWG